MKKLIYEVFYKNRSYETRDTIPAPEIRIYDDGSFELYWGYVEVSPSRDVIYHFPKDFASLEGIREEVMTRVNSLSRRLNALWPIHWGNSRYPVAFALLRATCGKIPFEEYRIVYHGEGEPWEQIYQDDVIF